MALIPWNPMIDAPRDGSGVLLWLIDSERTVLASWMSGGWASHSPSGDTHCYVDGSDCLGWLPAPTRAGVSSRKVCFILDEKNNIVPTFDDSAVAAFEACGRMLVAFYTHETGRVVVTSFVTGEEGPHFITVVVNGPDGPLIVVNSASYQTAVSQHARSVHQLNGA